MIRVIVSLFLAFFSWLLVNLFVLVIFEIPINIFPQHSALFDTLGLLIRAILVPTIFVFAGTLLLRSKWAVWLFFGLYLMLGQGVLLWSWVILDQNPLATPKSWLIFSWIVGTISLFTVTVILLKERAKTRSSKED